MNNVVEKIFAPHSSPGLSTLRFCLLNHVVGDVERFGSLSCVDLEFFKGFNVLMKKSYRMTSRRLLTTMHETAEIMSSALNNVQRSESQGHGSTVGASVFRKRKCMEGGGRCLVRDGMCLFVGQVSEEAERAGADVTVVRSLPAVLEEVLSGEGLTSFVNSVRE